MARQTTTLTVIVASPSDVAEERETVASAVNAWNQHAGRQQSVAVELLRWEETVAAGIGDDGQQVVNQQFGDEYDGIIALFWKKLGTPTARAASGSAEEIQLAIQRYRKQERVDVGVYFKDVPRRPSEVDPEQFLRLANFRKELEEDGVYHKSFESELDLAHEIQLFLSRLARLALPQLPLPPVISVLVSGGGSTATDFTTTHEEQEEPGFLDLLEDVQFVSTELTQLSARFVARMESLTAVANVQTQAMQDIIGLGPLQPADMRPIVKAVADELDSYSMFAENENANFGSLSIKLAEKTRNLVDVMHDFDPSASDLGGTDQMLESLEDALNGAATSLEGLQDTISGLQRLTSHFNKAKRRFVRSSLELVSSLRVARNIVRAAREELLSNRKLKRLN